jgi:hypothetical protein
VVETSLTGVVASTAVVPEVPAEFDEALLQLAAAPISTARPIAPKLLAFIWGPLVERLLGSRQDTTGACYHQHFNVVCVIM